VKERAFEGVGPADNTRDVNSELSPSEFRVEKQRTDAVVTLSSGLTTQGCFFIAGGSARHAGPERVAELLNSEAGFFPFEIHFVGRAYTVLYNRNQVVMVALTDNEARRDPGYDVATRRFVSILLSSGQRIAGAVRVYRPEGRDRLSDWARQPETFRYVETADDTTLIINVAHIIEVSEVTQS
jgi:hypothetical protein